MKKTAALSIDVRTRRREVSDQLQEHRNVIDREVQAKYIEETKVLRSTVDDLFEVEKEFMKELNEVFANVVPGTIVKVVVQVGPNGGDILREHKGIITKDFKHRNPCFNLSDDNYMDGKAFTIGASCIQSFEILA